jgi:hypothetical protein
MLPGEPRHIANALVIGPMARPACARGRDFLAQGQIVCAYILDEAAVDLVACPNEIVVLRHFDDHSLRERLRAAARSVIAKAAAPKGAGPFGTPSLTTVFIHCVGS